MSYIRRWIPTRRVGILAGSSVHADKAFLRVHLPAITGSISLSSGGPQIPTHINLRLVAL